MLRSVAIVTFVCNAYLPISLQLAVVIGFALELRVYLFV